MNGGWNDREPRYRQLKDRLIGKLLDGAWSAGDALPSVRQLAADCELDPNTVSKAYQELVNVQLVEKRRGVGMFVADGGVDQFLASERERFLRVEWPAMCERIRRLGLELHVKKP